MPGAEALQFRDVQGFSARVACLMSIGNNPTDFRVYRHWTAGLAGQSSSRTKIQVAFMMGSDLDATARNSSWRLNQWSVPRFSHP